MKTAIPRRSGAWAGLIILGSLGVALEASQARTARTVRTPIQFIREGGACISVKPDVVPARSGDNVHWIVMAQPECKYEGQAIAIVFTSGADPGKCQCTATFHQNAARLTLLVRNHSARQTYTYDIRVAGKPVADPRLEVDP